MKRFCRALTVIISIGMLATVTSGCSAGGRDNRRNDKKSRCGNIQRQGRFGKNP